VGLRDGHVGGSGAGNKVFVLLRAIQQGVADLRASVSPIKSRAVGSQASGSGEMSGDFHQGMGVFTVGFGDANLRTVGVRGAWEAKVEIRVSSCDALRSAEPTGCYQFLCAGAIEIRPADVVASQFPGEITGS
jgi:hypothetical protein